MGLNDKDCFATKLQCRWFVTDSSEAFKQCAWKLDCTKRETALRMKMHYFRRICIFCSLFLYISLNGKLPLKKAVSSSFFFFFEEENYIGEMKIKWTKFNLPCGTAAQGFLFENQKEVTVCTQAASVIHIICLLSFELSSLKASKRLLVS